MKVKLLVGFEGAESWPAGSEQDVEKAEAIRLIEAGYAVPVSAEKVERATTKPAPEKRG